jgi:hypothetical protein
MGSTYQSSGRYKGKSGQGTVADPVRLDPTKPQYRADGTQSNWATPPQPYKPASQYSSTAFDPTYMLPQGGTYSAARPNTQQGVLSKPGHYEDWYAANKDRLNAPTQGFGAMKEAADYFRGPNRTAAYADRAGGIFDKPGMAETYASGVLPGLQNKGYTEQLYESGNQGLNTHYDREWEKRRRRLEDTMSAAGVFGSGATARGLFELEAELGSQQARDMAGLATQADTMRGSRLGMGMDIANTGQQAGEGRVKGGADLQNLADASVDRQGRGLLAAGQGMDASEGAQLERAGGAAGKAQDFFEDRETGGLNARMTLADRMGGMVERFSGASNEEQAAIREDIIQTLIAEAGLDRQAAESIAEEWLTAGGNLARTQK